MDYCTIGIYHRPKNEMGKIRGQATWHTGNDDLHINVDTFAQGRHGGTGRVSDVKILGIQPGFQRTFCILLKKTPTSTLAPQECPNNWDLLTPAALSESRTELIP